MKYSVVVPIYNDGALARDFCLELRRVFSAYLHTDKIAAQLELIFVDDGSRNDSARKLKDLCDELDFVKAVVLSRNFGHHTAVAAGYRAAQGEYVAMLNVDQEDPIRFLPAMLDRIAQGDVDIVGCLRRPPYRVKFTSAWFHRVMNRLTGYTVPQNAGTLRVLTKRATETFAGLAEHNQYFPGLEMWLGLQYAWIETEHEERRAGRSSYNFRKRLRMAIASVISFSDFPLRYAVKIGMSIAGIGAALGLWLIIQRIFFSTLLPGYTSTLVVILFLGGAQIAVTGFASLYIGRILAEVQRRPLFVVREVYGEIPTASVQPLLRK